MLLADALRSPHRLHHPADWQPRRLNAGLEAVRLPTLTPLKEGRMVDEL